MTTLEGTSLPAVGHIDKLPGGWPDVREVAPFTPEEGTRVAEDFASRIAKLLCDPSADEIASLFHEAGFWRDQAALTWSLRTFHTRDTIAERLPELVRKARITPESVRVVQAAPVVLLTGFPFLSVICAFASEAYQSSCTASWKLIKLPNGDIKIFTVTTALQALDYAPWRPERLNLETQPKNDVHTNGDETRQLGMPKQTDIMVIGGSGAGLALSAYLKALGQEFVLVEREKAIGDSWSRRYTSATLHTIREFSGLPYLPFPPDYPKYVNGRLVGQYYASYAKQLELPVYAGRECEQAEWDEASASWTVNLRGPKGQETVTAKHLVFAVGIGGRFPLMPEIPGQDTFKGKLLHSAAYIDPSTWKGKKVAIVGASTTGIDVAVDCARLGIDVTLLQRGPTRVYPPGHLAEVKKPLWGSAMPTEQADTIASEDPMVLGKGITAAALASLSDNDETKKYFASLNKAGLLVLEQGSLQQQIFCRGGSHYPDVGAGQAIIDGEIKVVSGAAIDRMTATGIKLSDGDELSADIVCFATGYEKDLRKQFASIIGEKQASQLEPIWGLDHEGEARGTWRPTGHPGLWVQGGDLQLMRYYGKFLALQLAAALHGPKIDPVRS